MKSYLLPAILTLLTAGQAPAQYYQRPYYPPEVVYRDRVEYRDNYVPVLQPVPFTVAVPVVSYLFNGSSYAPVFNGQPAMQNPGLQVQTQQTSTQTQATAQSSQLSDAFVDMLIERIEQRLALRQQRQQGGPPPLRRGRAQGGDGGLAARATAILATNCAACHTGPQARGGQVIFSSPGILNASGDRKRWVDAADEGRMPPAARQNPQAAVSDGDVDILQRWAGVVKSGHEQERSRPLEIPRRNSHAATRRLFARSAGGQPR